MDRLTFGDDSEAWDYLEKRGYTEKQFLKQLPIRDMTEGEWDAVKYLCGEWDWGCYDTRKDLKGVKRWTMLVKSNLKRIRTLLGIT